MSNEPPPSESSHPESGFIFRARMTTTNLAEPLAPTAPKIVEVMEIGSEDEEVLSTSVTRKGKDKAQGSRKPLKAAKWATGNTKTSPRHTKSPRATPQTQAT